MVFPLPGELFGKRFLRLCRAQTVPEESPLHHFLERNSLLGRDNRQFMGSHQCIGEPSCCLAFLQNTGMNAIEQLRVLRDPAGDFDSNNRVIGVGFQIEEMDFVTSRAKVAI